MRRVLLFVIACAVALVVGAVLAAAQGFSQIAYATFTSNVALVTTAETVVVSSGPAVLPRREGNVCILGWAQLTTGADTTTVTPRIRRGTTASGTAVGEGNAETVKAAAGSTEPFFVFTCENRADIGTAEYSLTLEQASASANGAALQGGILVFVR
jgi:hypothetical protein